MVFQKAPELLEGSVDRLQGGIHMAAFLPCNLADRHVIHEHSDAALLDGCQL